MYYVHMYVRGFIFFCTRVPGLRCPVSIYAQGSTRNPQILHCMFYFSSGTLHVDSFVEAEHSIALQVTIHPLWRALVTRISNRRILLHQSLSGGVGHVCDEHEACSLDRIDECRC